MAAGVERREFSGGAIARRYVERRGFEVVGLREESSGSWWIEKTIVAGRRDRENGPEALGKALWSPKTSKSGTDIYRSMRDVRPGDVVLHLTDNSGFTGVSTVEAGATDFEGLPGTEWEGECWRAALRDFRPIAPALSRNVFFASPFKERLIGLLESGVKGLFYNREPSLNQGRYLTRCPPELLEILDDAYESVTGTRLTQVIGASPPEAEGPPTDSQLLLVGADRDAASNVTAMAERIATVGFGAAWWSFPLGEDQISGLERSPYLYLYEGVPKQRLTHRLRIAEYRTSKGDGGITSPWPDYTVPDEIGNTRAGPDRNQVFKTWFLVDQAEHYEPEIDLADLVRADGAPAEPSGLVGGFGLWRRRKVGQQEDPFAELSQRTFIPSAELRELTDIVRQRRQIILEGPPGAGKTYVADLLARYLTDNALEGPTNDRFEIVQFHPSYGYEDFVQGIRPETSTSGQLEYHVRPGIFMRLCAKAAAQGDESFVVVIDEINRGNLSRIFGELLLLLEYREKEVRLPYATSDEPLFRIPKNVLVIGTMNTTDRSLAQIDYALRRRFYFWRMLPMRAGRASVLEGWLERQRMPLPARRQVLQLFTALNTKLAVDLGEHYMVGHSYFMVSDIGTRGGQERVWSRAIMPLLEEYFFNQRDTQQLLAEFAVPVLLGRQTSDDDA